MTHAKQAPVSGDDTIWVRILRRKSALLIALTVIILVFMLAISVFLPDVHNNAFTVLLLNLFLVTSTAAASHYSSEHIVRKRVQQEWLMQAEGACEKLLVVKYQVARIKSVTSGECSEAIRTCPELEKEEMRTLKILLENNCTSAANRLVDLETQVDSALSDWKRFIRGNCEGAKCEQIAKELENRRIEIVAAGEAASTCRKSTSNSDRSSSAK